MAGWLAGWVYELKIRLNSASVVVEVEAEVEAVHGIYFSFLGKRQSIPNGLIKNASDQKHLLSPG